MTSYLVTIETDHHWTCFKMRTRDEPTASQNVRCWCFIFWEKTQKNLRGGGIYPPPPGTSEGYLLIYYWKAWVMRAGKDGKARVSSFSSLLPSSFPPSPSSKSPFESSTANGNDEKRLGRNLVCQVKSLLIQVYLRSGVPLLVCLCGFAFTSVSDLFAHLHVYRSKRFQGGFVINFGKKKLPLEKAKCIPKHTGYQFLALFIGWEY